MKHIYSVLVDNQPGVLARVANLFRRRGFNIESLAVGPTEKPELSRMTIVADAEDKPIEQVSKQLNKLINVVKIIELREHNAVARELALVKIKATPANRAQIIEIADIFRAKIVDVAKGSITIEITGNEQKIVAFTDLVSQFHIMELARTGKVALSRGASDQT